MMKRLEVSQHTGTTKIDYVCKMTDASNISPGHNKPNLPVQL
jgi:hypothetical protein